MKNIEKKWMLFLIATFVTFFGICYTLLKDTFALNTIDNTVDNTVQEFDSNYDSSNEYDIIHADNCELADIVFNDGKINFKKDVLEYDLVVNDIKNLEIDSMLLPSTLECSTHNNFVEEENMFVVTVYALDEVVSVYKINVSEKIIVDNVIEDKDNDYTYIFIVIIGILVLINIYRIVKKMRSK